jgi:N-methylhydantoinase A/oxoprolinase/acetone carboxylase beta subunit
MTRIVGVDVGGTFTDVAVFESGRITGFKVPTTEDQSDGVLGALDWRADDTLLHGTTAATNALLEERGARVVLVTDAGFEDVIEIARQDRPSLYDSAVDRPVALVPRERRVGHLDDLDETVRQLSSMAPEVLVVGLVEGYRDTSVEARLASAIGDALDVVTVPATAISPQFREYERIATGVLSAYLTPAVSGYLRGLLTRLPAARSLVMTSAGGLSPFEQAADTAARLVLSGPAGGVVAAASLARHHGHHEAIAFDMGGTSTDVCRIVGASVPVGSGHRVAGRVNRVPSVPVRTIGAGGGSIGWVDPGGGLRVGPKSAGASPGPAAYGFGGIEPTVTDANLAAGHLPPELALAGELRLDWGLARDALERLGSRVGLTAEATAAGMLEIVDSHMEHALRSVTVEEGADPRDSVLVAFGGAGGLHAGRLARRLGVPKVLIPRLSGVFSALGLLLATPRADAAKTVMLEQGSPTLEALTREVAADATNRYREVFGEVHQQVEIGFDCRYRGQSHELEVGSDPEWGSIVDAFESAHRQQFGFVRDGEMIELVNVRVSATGVSPLTWGQLGAQLPSTAPIPVEGVWERSQLPGGFEVIGPAVIVEDTSAVLVQSGETVTTLDDGTLELTFA